MSRILPATLTLFLAGATVPAFGAPPSRFEAQKYARAIGDAEHWGQLMFEHDQAASKATDIVLANPVAAADNRVRGWVTEATASGIHVAFVGEDKGRNVVLYETTPSKQSTSTSDSPGRELTADESREFNARQTAIAAFAGRCSNSYNTVVLPAGSGSDQEWRVYLIPGTTDANIIPAGGYYLYEISPDGKRIVRQRAFTRGCLNLTRSDAPAGATGAIPFVTHLLDPQPDEVHVFISLTYKTPLYVSTVANSLSWKVTGTDIEPVAHANPSR